MEHSPTFAYRFNTEADFATKSVPEGVAVDVVGLLLDVDGWHVNTSAPIGDWADWQIFPKHMQRVFA